MRQTWMLRGHPGDCSGSCKSLQGHQQTECWFGQRREVQRPGPWHLLTRQCHVRAMVVSRLSGIQHQYIMIGTEELSSKEKQS